MAGPDDVPFFPVLRGLVPGEIVVTAGSFLVDAETRLNPAAGSIYFGGSGGSKSGSTVRPSTPEDSEATITQALARLSADDRKIAEKQQFCPILPDNKLGAMGVPVKVMLENQPVFLCCDGCKKQAQDNPKETLAKVRKLKEPHSHSPGTSPHGMPAAQKKDPEAKIQAALAKLSDTDRNLAAEQRFCVVLPKNRLGSMGTPVKLDINGKPVFLCCEGCRDDALADPEATLKKVESLKTASAK
jgi:hypothetical protein